jgi:hypothetical protein
MAVAEQIFRDLLPSAITSILPKNGFFLFLEEQKNEVVPQVFSYLLGHLNNTKVTLLVAKLPVIVINTPSPKQRHLLELIPIPKYLNDFL